MLSIDLLPTPLLETHGLGFAFPDSPPLFQGLNLTLRPGLTLLLGGDGRGKTTLLRLLAGRLAPTAGTVHRAASGLYLEDLGDPALDTLTVRAWLSAQRALHPAWDAGVEARLIEAYDVLPHLDKALFMLSTGGRRKAGLVAAAACGAALTFLDLPCAALDAPSRRVLTGCLSEAAAGRQRAWLVADHLAPAGLPAVPVIDLGS